MVSVIPVTNTRNITLTVEKPVSPYAHFISQTLAYADDRDDGAVKVKIRNLKGQCIIWTKFISEGGRHGFGPKLKERREVLEAEAIQHADNIGK